MKKSILLGAAGLALVAVPALAQQRLACGDRSAMLNELKDKYQESPAGAGVTDNGAVVELTTSAGGSWTLLLSMPDGKSCLIGTGEGWEQAKIKQTKEPGKDA